MDFRSFLETNHVDYEWLCHTNAYSAQQLAQREHVPGDEVIKAVVVQADGQFVLCCLPATYRIDWDELRRELRADVLRLASEMELPAIFDECELGAEPPFGNLFGLPMLMDASVFADEMVTFQAGTHSDAVRISFGDFIRLSQPKIGHFARHA